MKKITLLFGLLVCLAGFGQTSNITFQVDMNSYPGTIANMEVFGTFNNFAGGVSIMTDLNSDGIYDITIPITNGQIEFLFAVDSVSFAYKLEDFTATKPFCTLTTGNFTNRVFTVAGDSTLPVVCWESCLACNAAPVDAQVTFRVDMSDYTGTFTNVNFSSELNNWCGDCAYMTPVGNNIYELQVTTPKDTFEYKFSVDNWTDDESLNQGDPCTLTTTDMSGTFTNRFLVPDNDTILPAVCWGSCSSCGIVSISENDWIKDFKVSPNPNNGVFDISGNLNSNEDIRITVVDMQGRLIYEATELNNTISRSIDISTSEQGMYILNISSDSNVLTEKIIYTN